jgi:hypothetical protein
VRSQHQACREADDERAAENQSLGKVEHEPVSRRNSEQGSGIRNFRILASSQNRGQFISQN